MFDPFQRNWFLVVLLLFVIISLLGCTTLTGKKEAAIKKTELGKKTLAITPSEETVLEDEGILIVIHGSACADSDKPGGVDHVSMNGSLKMPQYVDRATVFLNGWNGKYLSDDHEFSQLLADINDIKFSGNTLTWNAVGSIADENFDDPFQWCCYYTAIGWNSKFIDAIVDHQNGSCNNAGECTGNVNFHEAKNQIPPLSYLSSYVFNKSFVSKKEIAILPRGFTFAYLPYFNTDHHLYQIAYNFDHSEKIIQNPKSYDHLELPNLPTDTSRVGSGYASWETQTILKDNDDTRNYRFWETFSAIAGDDVGIIQPPFSIRPMLNGSYGCVYYSGGVETVERTIDDIPFEYAIPVLNGWSLYYQCDDEHVKEIGIWIHDVEYKKIPGELTGTLKYKVSSILVDNDWEPGHVARHKVSILGLVGTTPSVDLLPIESQDHINFCKRDSNKRLEIIVMNKGSLDAPATTTTVAFQTGGSFDVATPPIPAGKRVIVYTPKLPASCFIPNCEFTIMVDSKSVVTEFNEVNNTVTGECKG